MPRLPTVVGDADVEGVTEGPADAADAARPFASAPSFALAALAALAALGARSFAAGSTVATRGDDS
jgi:hypothetical protein